MKFTRCSRGIATLAIVLALLALFFDALPLAIASGAFVVFLVVRAALFFAALSSTAGSLSIHRSLSSLLVRQGTSVTVETVGQIAIPPGFSLALSDLPPHGGVSSSSATTTAVSGKGSFHLNYTLSPLTPGEHAFDGIRLAVSDHYFSAELLCRSTDMAAPSLVILPSADYALDGRDVYGEKETPGTSVLKSPDIRSFREYLPGDDLRTIDWKISAKYDTLYVREYMGRKEHATLLVVDLPDSALPFSEKAFSRLKEAAVSAIITQMSDRVPFSVLIISGPNLVTFSPLVLDPQRLVAMMNQLAPFPRLHHLYRYRSTASLKHRFSSFSGSGDPFSRALCRISTTFLSRRSTAIFESQVGRVLHTLPGSSAHLFTLAAHDASHLRIFSEQAALHAVHIRFHIPKEGVRDPARLGCSLAAPVEVV